MKPLSSIEELKATLIQKAEAEGFALCRITRPRLPLIKGREFIAFLRAGCQGDMSWLYNKAGRRRSPHALWPDAQSAIVLAMPYHNAAPVQAHRGLKNQGIISVYAQGGDYHDVIKPKLKKLGRWLVTETNAPIKVFVDTAPIMEKPLAELAGVGWQGKHTNLVSQALGGWFFLGVILAREKLPFDKAETNHCGVCRACIDICPTRAITAPYRLDASACISYLTIEHKGPVPVKFRKAIGNRIYGCDDCLAVCPWNKFAKAATQQKLMAREPAQDPDLHELLKLDEVSFKLRFSGSPIKRIGYIRFLRNVIIAAGNSDDINLMGPVAAARHHDNEIISETADWAYQQLINSGKNN